MKPAVLQDLIGNQAVDEFAKRDRWAIFPLGSTEYHGPRGPYGTDSDVAWKVGEKVARATGALLLPALHYGDSGFHRDYPGTLHVKTETLKSLIVDVAASVKRNGAEKLLLLLGHWGNLEAALKARDEAGASGMGVRIEVARVFDPALLECERMDRAFGGKPWAGHGGAAEISVAFCARPHVTPPSAEQVSRESPPPAEREYSRLGWAGLPESASAELGAEAVEIASAAIVRYLDKLDAS